MFWLSFLGSRISQTGGTLQHQSEDVASALKVSNFNATDPLVKTNLLKMEKTLQEFAFVRTEILLANERKKRRTMTRAQIQEMEARMRNGSAKTEFTHFMGNLGFTTLPPLPEEWKNVLIKAGDLVDDPALEVEECQSAGKAMVEILAMKAKEQ